MNAQWLDTLWDIVFPPHASCMGCGDPFGSGEEWLCEACAANLTLMRDAPQSRCPICGGALRDGVCHRCAKWESRALSMARSAFVYRPPVSGLVRRFKYSGVTILKDWMAGKMVEMIGAEHMPAPDALVPVPLHRRRLRERGFNQSLLLAEAISSATGIPVLDAMKRKRYTRRQALLSARGRRKNLDNAFAVTAPVRGMRLMLVDDVLTTGTTALRCAMTLTQAGAFDVTLITFATAT